MHHYYYFLKSFLMEPVTILPSCYRVWRGTIFVGSCFCIFLRIFIELFLLSLSLCWACSLVLLLILTFFELLLLTLLRFDACSYGSRLVHVNFYSSIFSYFWTRPFTEKFNPSKSNSCLGYENCIQFVVDDVFVSIILNSWVFD